jgi:hypothetical protein
MILFWFSFGTILLSVLFLKDMLAGEFAAVSDLRRKKWTKGLSVAMAALLAVTLLFSMKDLLVGIFPFISDLDTQKRQIFDANFSRNFVPMLWLWLCFALATLGCIIAVLNQKIKPGVALTAVFLMGLIDVLRVDAQFIKVIDSRPYFGAEPALQSLKSEMAAAPFRCFSLPGALSQNGEGINGLEGVGGFHDNELRWYREWRGDQRDKNYFDKLLGFSPKGEPYLKADQIGMGNAFLDIANAKYLLVRNGQDLLALENKNALGRVSFAPRYTVMDSIRIVPSLMSNGYDYRTTVALLKEPLQKPPAATADSSAPAAGPMTVEWKRYTPNDRVAAVTVPQDGFLRISEVYYPGWKVMVDGKPAAINRSDLAWMAVFVPKGSHEIEMTIHSLYFAKSVWISLITVFLLACYWSVLGFGSLRKAA